MEGMVCNENASAAPATIDGMGTTCKPLDYTCGDGLTCAAMPGMPDSPGVCITQEMCVDPLVCNERVATTPVEDRDGDRDGDRRDGDRMEIDGLGSIESRDDEVRVQMDGFGTITAEENRDGSMEISIRMGAAKVFVAAATIIGATLTLQ